MRLAHLGRFRDALAAIEECLNFTAPLNKASFTMNWDRATLTQVTSNARAAAYEVTDMGLDEARTSSAHFNLGTIHMRNDAYAKAVKEFELAEAHADAAKTSKTSIYKVLAILTASLAIRENQALIWNSPQTRKTSIRRRRLIR